MRQKTYSDIKPEKGFDITNVKNGKCTVLFFDEVQEKIEESIDENGKTTGKTVYNYYVYELETIYRDNLEEDITNNLENWLTNAKEIDYNEIAADVRTKRDALLAETDWTQMTDTALSEEEQEQYKTYRQSLRDIPEQTGFPYDVEFPEKP